MKKILLMLLLGVLVIAFTTSALLADEMASATKRVSVKVLPNIGLGAGTPEQAEIQTGRFYITVPFQVDANTQYITLCIAATHLYKADDPASEVPFISLCTDKTVKVNPFNGNEAGGDNELEWDIPATIDGFDGFQTVCGLFESSQSGRFSMPVDVMVCWIQDDDEKPIGEYSGWVQMMAYVEPAGGL